MHIYRVPKRFIDDHWERDLAQEGDWVVHETKQHYYVRMSDSSASDLESDADYYADSTPGWSEGLEGIRSSARWTLKAMRTQLQQIKETGSTEWDGKFTVTPEHCMDCGEDITCVTKYAGGRCYPCHGNRAMQGLWASMMQSR